MFQTAEEMKEFLLLNRKSQQELQEICLHLGVENTGTKEDILQRLSKQKKKQDISSPQLIPISTKDAGEDLLISIRVWRKQLFDARYPTKVFTYFSQDGKPLQQKMKYLTCKSETLVQIIKNRWYYQHPTREPLINELEQHPEIFDVSIVLKPGKNGNNWLMLHCCPKEDKDGKNRNIGQNSDKSECPF